MTYPTGAVKHDPTTKAVAVRTLGAQDGPLAWGVMTVDHGGHYATDTDVADWLDVPITSE